MQRYEGIWRKRQLLPSWILQCIFSAIFAVIAILLLAAANWLNSGDTYYGYTRDQLVEYARVTGGVVLAVSLATILLDVAEAVLYKRRALDPVFLLVTSVLKTAVWGAWLILCIISAAVGSVSALDLVFGIVLAGTSAVQLYFAAENTHRKRKGRLPSSGAYDKDVSLEAGQAGYPVH
ncbi:hypothetical protein F5Y15DRAFT_288219 [Xylariaceae sp. FL0016]|nr:hypothetical protein F5Y15DRAFT_288219 [Xylariaceae sp. FL0016]